MAPAELQALLADPRVVWTEDVLRFGDTDANGHINNALFATLCESGRVNLFRTRFDPTLPKNRFFVIARLGIDFRAELNFPGSVRTGTWITRLGRSSVSLAQVILSGDKLAAEADAVCVLMDGATRRPMPYPDETRRRSRACCGRRRAKPQETGGAAVLCRQYSARFEGHGMAQTAIHARMTAAEWAILVGLSVLWGGSFLFVGVAVAELPPLTIVVAAGRACGGDPCSWRCASWACALPRERRVWVAFLGMGMLNNAIPFTLFAWGQANRRAASPRSSTPRRRSSPSSSRIVFTADEKATRQGSPACDRIWRRRGDDRRRDSADARRRRPGAARLLAARSPTRFAGVYGRRFRAMGVAPVAAADRPLTASTLLILPLVLIFDRPGRCRRRAPRRLGAPRARAVLDRARLHPLFPAARLGRRDQPPARHLPDPGERDPARRARSSTSGSRRATSSAWR